MDTEEYAKKYLERGELENIFYFVLSILITA